MKKFTLSLIAAIASVSFGYSQANLNAVAPPFTNNTTNLRAPNGMSVHAVMRGCFFVQASELTNLTMNSLITSFGFSLTNGNSVVATPGTFTLYFQNTTNTSYLKGTIWSTALTGMQMVYNGPMTIPVSANPTTITLPINPNFTYTGAGLYVAYDWASSGPFDAVGATYAANAVLATGGASADFTATPAPTGLNPTAFRPVYIFDATNTSTNDVTVTKLDAPGKVIKLFNSSQIISAEIKNVSNVALNNIQVNLNVGGVNPFTDNQMVGSLAAGSTATVSFVAYNPQNIGINTISVSVANDQYNSNNMITWNQSVNCNTVAANPTSGSFAGGVGFNTGSGIIVDEIDPTINCELKSVRIAISSDASAVGRGVFAVLLDNGGNIQAATNTIVITAGMAGTFQNFIFPVSQPITGGNIYYVGLAQPANATGYFPVGAQQSNALFIGNYFTAPLAGGTAPTPLTSNLGYFGIEPLFTFTETTISVAATKSLMCLGDASQLTATGASTSYTWSASANTGTTSTAIVSPSVNTTYTVAGFYMGCKSNVAGITVSVSACTGLSANGISSSEIRVFPNPAVNAKSTITGLEGTNKIVVFNILGQAVITQTTSEETATLDLSGQPNGTYLVKISDAYNNSKTVKIVNQN